MQYDTIQYNIWWQHSTIQHNTTQLKRTLGRIFSLDVMIDLEHEMCFAGKWLWFVRDMVDSISMLSFGSSICLFVCVEICRWVCHGELFSFMSFGTWIPQRYLVFRSISTYACLFTASQLRLYSCSAGEFFLVAWSQSRRCSVINLSQ